MDMSKLSSLPDSVRRRIFQAYSESLPTDAAHVQPAEAHGATRTAGKGLPDSCNVPAATQVDTSTSQPPIANQATALAVHAHTSTSNGLTQLSSNDQSSQPASGDTIDIAQAVHRSTDSREPLGSSSNAAIPALKSGLAIMDDFLTPAETQAARQQAEVALQQHAKPAGMGGANFQSRWLDQEARGDQMMWLNVDREHSLGRAALASVLERLGQLREQLQNMGYDVLGKVTYQLAVYPGRGARYVRHADASPSCPTRCITAIVYLNTNWDAKANGGNLAIYNVAVAGANQVHAGHEAGEPATIIAPLAGRLVVFESHIEHEVLPTHANRFAITAWFHRAEQPPPTLLPTANLTATVKTTATDAEYQQPDQFLAPTDTVPAMTLQSVSHELMQLCSGTSPSPYYGIVALLAAKPYAPTVLPDHCNSDPHTRVSMRGVLAHDMVQKMLSFASVSPAAALIRKSAFHCDATAKSDMRDKTVRAVNTAPTSTSRTSNKYSQGGARCAVFSIGWSRLPAPGVGRIFVSIACFRDPECQYTVHSLLSEADHPGNVSVGIVWQVDPVEDLGFVKVAGTKGRPEWLQQVREVRLPASQATGPCKARALAQQLWDGEDYFLQIDSHMRFVKGWDTLLISQLEQATARSTHGKAVLSTYPPSYDGEGYAARAPSVAPVTVLCATGFGPDGLLRITGRTLKTAPAAPVACSFWAAGFSFSSSSLIHEVPYCPHLPGLFFGEEQYQLARMWTRGWDVFAPACPIAFHQWERHARTHTFQKHMHGHTQQQEAASEDGSKAGSGRAVTAPGATTSSSAAVCLFHADAACPASDSNTTSITACVASATDTASAAIAAASCTSSAAHSGPAGSHAAFTASSAAVGAVGTAVSYCAATRTTSLLTAACNADTSSTAASSSSPPSISQKLLLDRLLSQQKVLSVLRGSWRSGVDKPARTHSAPPHLVGTAASHHHPHPPACRTPLTQQDLPTLHEDTGNDQPPIHNHQCHQVPASIPCSRDQSLGLPGGVQRAQPVLQPDGFPGADWHEGGIWGLGSVRTLQEFQHHIGVDFGRQGIEARALWGGLPPDMF